MLQFFWLVVLALAAFWAYKHWSTVKSWFAKAPVSTSTPAVPTPAAPTADNTAPPGNAPPAA